MSYLTNPFRYVISRSIWYDTLSETSVNDEAINKTGDALKRGEAPINASSPMIGEEVGQVKCYIRYGDASLTGTVYCYVRNMSTDAIVATIGSLDASTITNSFVLYTFTTGSPYTMTVNDTISLECSWAASTTEFIRTTTAQSDIFANSGKSYFFTASGWSTDVKDWIASISN